DEAVAGDPRPLAPRDAEPRQPGEPADGVQVEPVVVGAPAGADRACPVDYEPSGEDFQKLLELFYRPRVRLFTLLNLLMEHQEVEERLLFNYLIDEFNNFLAIGVKADGSAAFMQGTGARLSILLTAWGSQVKARKLLFPVG
ncbi:MAG TPA: hypothetical protein PKH78_12830, partial [Candidatus Obscuribacter sp.]|nr:hypothetical protein [Candidatus Obscuribacter sp.]